MLAERTPAVGWFNRTRFAPARLIAFDQAESELFKIDCELRELFPDLELVAALGDVRDLLLDRAARTLSQPRLYIVHGVGSLSPRGEVDT